MTRPNNGKAVGVWPAEQLTAVSPPVREANLYLEKACDVLDAARKAEREAREALEAAKADDAKAAAHRAETGKPPAKPSTAPAEAALAEATRAREAADAVILDRQRQVLFAVDSDREAWLERLAEAEAASIAAVVEAVDSAYNALIDLDATRRLADMVSRVRYDSERPWTRAGRFYPLNGRKPSTDAQRHLVAVLALAYKVKRPYFPNASSGLDWEAAKRGEMGDLAAPIRIKREKSAPTPAAW